jgi:FkbM family methyltransferase
LDKKNLIDQKIKEVRPINTFQRKYKFWETFIQPLPAFFGKQRLARRFLGKYLETKECLLRTRSGSLFFVPCLREAIAINLFTNGFYEHANIQVILRHLSGQKDGLFLDIGANIGLYSIQIDLETGDNIHSIAVEASPKCFKYLVKNIKINNAKNIHCMRVAVAENVSSSVPFYEAPDLDMGMGSFSPQFHDDPIPVETTTIDMILKEGPDRQVRALKVDVEGYESKVFEGASRLLRGKEAPLICFEFMDWAERRAEGINVGDSQRVLKGFGYDIWKITDYMKGKKPLDNIIEKGCFDLVALKR